MDADGNREPPIRRPTRIPVSSFSMKPFCFLSILILFLAISLGLITRTTHFRVYLLKATISPHPNVFQELLKFLRFSPVEQKEVTETPYCILWMAPFLSGGGYSTEAWSYILALNSYIRKQKNPFFKLRIEQHGDQENVEFWEGLPLEMRILAIELHQTQCRLDQTIVVCHSEPGAWHPPLFETFPCPPTGYGRFKVVIGRTMFETDRVNLEHVRRCNRMDHVWVPTDFHVNTFRQSGIDPIKVRKVVQPVDLEFFDPFKKGVGCVVEVYLKEFSGVDDVALYLLTNAYHTDKDFANKIVEYVEDSDLEKPANGWAPIYVIDGHIAQIDLPGLYMSANAFVLPSRGEGWGRPIVEAMAMLLPVITTNWSGPTEYLTDENSYPLPVEGMTEVKEGPFKGHLWAEPSTDKLQLLMRHVMINHSEAKSKGMKARLDMMRRFSLKLLLRTSSVIYKF
ncbi:UNVERIFIED_CONTAM: hypothetical protein Scaly_2505100 [Sesamum calycinum]|uniref:Glycosyl transferase family 1 domain-containing protein n=1 Tax=Sesamum calycinum TaxID=2727403 RepID=A0AAW2LTE4_9LAMI